MKKDFHSFSFFCVIYFNTREKKIIDIMTDFEELNISNKTFLIVVNHEQNFEIFF